MESVVSDSAWPYGLWPARLLCPWDSPGKNTGVDCHALLQWIPRMEPGSLMSPMLAGRFFTTSTTWEAPLTALLRNKSQTMKSALFKVCSSGVFGIFQELYNCHHYFCCCQKKLQTQEQSLFTLSLASGNYQFTLSGFVCPGHFV